MHDGTRPTPHDNSRLSSLAVSELLDGIRDALRRRAEAEARIEQTVGAELRTTEESLGTSLRGAEETHQAALRSHEETYGRIEAEARASVEQERKAVDAEHADERERIAETLEPEEERLAAQLREAVWLAETMYEANEEKPDDEYNRTRAALEADLRRLQSLESRLVGLMASLRQNGVVRRYKPPVGDVESIADACERSSELVDALSGAKLPRLFESLNPFLVWILLAAAAPAFVAWRDGWTVGSDVWIASGAGAVGALIIMLVAHRLARRAVAQRYQHAARLMQGGYASHERELAAAGEERKAFAERLVRQRDSEVVSARLRFGPKLEELRARRAEAEDKAASTHARKMGALEQRVAETIGDARTTRDERTDHATREHATTRESISGRHHERRTELKATLEREREAMVDDWRTRTNDAYAALTRVNTACESLFPEWDDAPWRHWRTPLAPPSGVRFGSLAVDLASLPGGLPDDPALAPDGPLSFDLPALLDVPDRCSMLIEADAAGRPAGIDLLRAVMVRLLTTFPPGQARFTIFDPVGLGQNFAGFMHLADYEEALVSDRIWTEQRHIERRLTDLTEHMENVIQKYLRNEFATITAYNERAGEIAEPYRFLVIADFPANFNESSVRRLLSILQSGPRCGVFTLILRDLSQRLPSGVSREDLESAGVLVSCRKGKITVDDSTSLGGLTFTPEPAPPESLVTSITRRIGQAAKETSRVEVPFGVVAPPDSQRWTSRCDKVLAVPIGRATKVQQLELGTGTLQHVLIAGKTGSGKSTLLHVFITNLAMWHHPDEVQFYLVDFKKGVEFKTYATHALPHARAVAIESEREFGLSVLQEVDAELRRRGAIYRELGVQDLAGYRRATTDNEPMPRLLLIIDEFQELYTEDDKIAQEASLLLDRLVRQGRAFGIHVILGSQTLGGAYTLARSTMGQMGVRIALQCSEADSYLILSEDNAAARLLARPGEAIYNDASGLIEGNTPFQIVWLSDEERDQALAQVSGLAAERGYTPAVPQVVFEGNVAANPARNTALATLLDGPPAQRAPNDPIRIWLGSAVAIKEPTAAQLVRHTGSNVVIVGQRENEARGMLAAAVVATAAQTRAVAGARTIVIDGDDEAAPSIFAPIANALPDRLTIATPDALRDTIGEIFTEVRARRDAGDTRRAPLLFVIAGLHALRELRRKDDDYSFGFGDDDAEGAVIGPDRMLSEILDEGPVFGVHTIAWCDSVLNLNRAIDRRTMRAFENRVLFQMSQTDSSDLIDSVQAARLGVHRALFYSEETGEAEKFHPYGPPGDAWISTVVARLTGP